MVILRPVGLDLDVDPGRQVGFWSSSIVSLLYSLMSMSRLWDPHLEVLAATSCRRAGSGDAELVDLVGSGIGRRRWRRLALGLDDDILDGLVQQAWSKTVSGF